MPTLSVPSSGTPSKEAWPSSLLGPREGTDGMQQHGPVRFRINQHSVLER